MAESNRDWRAESLGAARELALPQGTIRYHSVGSGPASCSSTACSSTRTCGARSSPS